MPIFELEVDDVEAALQVLHSELSEDLEQLEARIRAGTPPMKAITPVSAQAESTMSEWHAARTALHSGLESIAEVLGWIQLKTEEEPEGAVAIALQPLPTLRGWSIH
jgi:hypothetical protein